MAQHDRKPQKKGFRLPLWLLIPLGILLIIVIIVIYMWFDFLGKLEAPDPKGQAQEVIIARGSDAKSIAAQLEKLGLIRDAGAFGWYLRLYGKGNDLKAGTYRLSPSQSVPDIVDMLAAGKEDMLKLTIPEGLTVPQIADRIAKEGVGDRAKFLYACQQGDPKGRLGKEGVEGYLYPDTYIFPHGTSEEQLRDMMLDRFCAFWTPEREQAAQASGRTRREVVILASIVEREAAVDSERPIIAGVFINRLKKGMMLQSCATVEYAIGEHHTVLTIQDMKVDSPYNTYKYAGLPPGPICCPGEKSLLAALNPAKTDYLYFVSRNDGTHQFSKTFGEHEKGRIEYQHNKDKKKGK
jgi:UPF0755 protein